MHVEENSSPTARHEQIAHRAYEIWRAQGCPCGQDLDNWLEAERQLRTSAVAMQSRPPDWEDDGLAAEVERRLDEITEPPQPRSPTSLDFTP
ncbi:MAG TPA: DUF2934 domain-containing protein [Opitutaceae bacterium]|nr:DUF2934 domain-containing protein [Opitutaceae bacterium]